MLSVSNGITSETTLICGCDLFRACWHSLTHDTATYEHLATWVLEVTETLTLTFKDFPFRYSEIVVIALWYSNFLIFKLV